MGFGEGLNGGIVAKSFEPQNFGITAKPGHLAFGVLTCTNGCVRNGFVEVHLPVEMSLSLPVPNRFHRFSLGSIALGS